MKIRRNPSRDFSPNLKQDLTGLSGFFRQLRSKSCFKMSGLSGSWTVYLKKNAQKPRKIWTVLSGLSKKTAQNLIIKSRPRRDSNPQSSDSNSDALSISLCGLAASLIFVVFVLLNMFNVLDMHNKYTVRIFIVSLYKITKLIDYKIAHQPPPPYLLLELMSPSPLTRVDVPY